MTIRVGTIVTRYFPGFKEIPCEDHIDWARSKANLEVLEKAGQAYVSGICLGVVIECIDGESDVTVNWLQMCPFAKKTGVPAQESINYNLLYEVGQLL